MAFTKIRAPLRLRGPVRTAPHSQGIRKSAVRPGSRRATPAARGLSPKSGSSASSIGGANYGVGWRDGTRQSSRGGAANFGVGWRDGMR
jgi:hypothetical protein